MASYVSPNGSYNGNMQGKNGANPHGVSSHPSQPQRQFQTAQVHPQQQQAGVNPFLNHPQQQMALTVAQPGSQTNQWSTQPPQQHSSFQQPAHNVAMPFVGGQYVAPIPPYTPNPQQMTPNGQGQGVGQNMGLGQMPSTQQVATYRPNSSLQAQQMQQQHQPQRQRSQQQKHKPAANEDFFGDFSSFNRRSSTLSTEASRPTTEIQTSGNNEDVSVLSKSTAGRSRTKRLTPFEDPKFAPAPPRVEGLKTAKNIAVNAPPDSDPLPDFDKITHSGFCLARISFRSILIKKWKQVFWVTYGTTKILVFRSNTDFLDWVSNPYLTKVQRDFLVKMEVDLVQDAQKLNIKGYQVTNLRCKSYQNSMLHQFKLERWMDYGPTIAAAFASERESDVYNLRTILSEMMKMHPQQSQHMDNRALEIHHARTYDSVRHDSERGYNDAGHHYISGSASAGALSDGASVKSARTVRSFGVVDKVKGIGSSAAGSVRSAAGSARSLAGSAAGSARSLAGSAAGSVKSVASGAAGSVKSVASGAAGSVRGAAGSVRGAAGSVRNVVRRK